MELAVITAWHVAAFCRQERLQELSSVMDRISQARTQERDPGSQLLLARAIHEIFKNGVRED